jgi:predicted nucleic acid-binding protein
MKLLTQTHLRRKDMSQNAIPIITLIEVLRGLDDKKGGLVKQLLEESFEVKGLDNETIQTYCRVYQKLKKKKAWNSTGCKRDRNTAYY